MLATIIMALAMLVTGTVTSLAQPEPSFRATCSELRAAVAKIKLVPTRALCVVAPDTDEFLVDNARSTSLNRE